jgi:AcrR family transcriptional regulator
VLATDPVPANDKTDPALVRRGRVGRPRKEDESPVGTRQELLEATIAYVGDNGFSELSLRGLGSTIGSSHRILIYHFKSKALLLAAVVEAIESRFSAKLIDLDERTGISPADQIRQIWAELTSPDRLVYGKLYVEMFAQEMTGKGSGLFATLDVHWVSALTRVSLSAGRSPEQARIEGRLGLAILRGLYFDLLANGDAEGVRKAWDSYLARYEK